VEFRLRAPIAGPSIKVQGGRLQADLLMGLIISSNNLYKISTLTYCSYSLSMWGQAVASLVETPCYKPEGRGFDSR
jgi:hypothetical protein